MNVHMWVVLSTRAWGYLADDADVAARFEMPKVSGCGRADLGYKIWVFESRSST